MVCRLTVSNPQSMKLHGLLLICRSWRDGRLSWPGWLTHSGHFTHEVVTCQIIDHCRSGKVHQPKTDILTTEPRHITSVVVHVCVWLADVCEWSRCPPVSSSSEPAYASRRSVQSRAENRQGDGLPVPQTRTKHIFVWVTSTHDHTVGLKLSVSRIDWLNQ